MFSVPVSDNMPAEQSSTPDTDKGASRGNDGDLDNYFETDEEDCKSKFKHSKHYNVAVGRY